MGCVIPGLRSPRSLTWGYHLAPLRGIEGVAQKSTEGELTEDERAEYAGYVRANKFVAIFKRQAQQIANSQS